MFPCHQAAWLIKPGVILHKKMQDFTVGHAYLLEAMDSPFMYNGTSTFSDLAVAALVCSMPFAKAREYLMRPPSKIKAEVEWWGTWCRLLGIDPENEKEKFKDYISAYFDSPEPWREKNEKPKQSCLPMSIRLAWLLMDRMSEENAWNCPMARALAYFTAQAEFNGQEFMTEEEATKAGAI